MSQRIKRTRKIHQLSHRLHRDLSLYALAASAAGVSALALASRAEAQIVYTPAHEVLSGDGHLSLDFNQDGFTDVTLHEFRCSPSTFFPGNSLQAVPQPGGGGIRQGFSGAAPMMPGQKVGPASPFYDKAAIMVNWTSYGVYYQGSWLYDKNTYLGIRFLIEGETHYGWARLNVSYNYPAKKIIALVTGYAYQTQANTTILAGDEGKGNGDSASRPVSSGDKTPASLGLLALGTDGVARRATPPLQRCPH